MIGQTISHYKILEKLGEGGMGVVYKAEDMKLDRTVALKFLPATVVSSPDEVARFEQEAKAISALNHPNIATIYDIDEADGKRFLVLEYIAGGTMKSKLKKLKSNDKEFTVAEVIDYGIQIAEGLGHAHSHQIVHRDIKSDNIMLTDEGKVKITDFGLAKLRGTTHLTRTGSTIGTLAYMAPEQLRGEDIDHRADLFSLGVVLYEMGTSRLPFRGEHEAALTYSIANEDPAPVKSLRQNLPSALEQVITKCLLKDRALRYQSADEIIADLRKLQREMTGTVKTVVMKQQSKLPWLIAAAVIVLGVIGVYLFMSAAHPTGPNSKTIAVLPFTNMSSNPEDQYFSDGITEDVITQLAKLGKLKVISRTSIMQYRTTERNLKDIGKELGVATILEGSVRREGHQIRVVAQLIDASSDNHLWAETYDREFTQIFAIQKDLAERIAKSLEAKISSEEQERLASIPTENLEAYDLYLKGRYHWNKRLPVDLKKGIAYFEQALAQDPLYAKAYAGLADSYIILGDFNILPPVETYPKAKAAALKALEIDPELPEAHVSLAYALTHYDWDWARAEKEFIHAIALAPNSAQAHSWYALFLLVTGRSGEAVAESRRARELDPFSAVVRTDAGLVSYFSRQYDAAMRQFLEAVQLDPSFVMANIPLGGAYVQKKMYAEAIRAFEQLSMASSVATSKAHPIPIAALAYVYGVSGRKEDAVDMIELLEEKSKEEYIAPYWMSVAHIGLGHRAEALDWLERAYRERDGSMIFLNVDPIFDTVRSDVRFAALLKKMGLDE
jgi:serine/threonine protein kinase/Flp pilus assembly protein TadD